MAERSEGRSESCVTDSDYNRPESCFTAASYNPSENRASTQGSQLPSDNVELAGLRLTRARLWLLCDLLSSLSADELAPEEFKGEDSVLDTLWKKAWLLAVQTPLSGGITWLDRLMATDNVRLSSSVREVQSTLHNDCERLYENICGMLQKKSDSTPKKIPFRGRIMAHRVTRTMLLVIGELCGDLGESNMIPTECTAAKRFLDQDAEISPSNRSYNNSLSKDFKDNLMKMQETMSTKLHDLLLQNKDLYEQELEGRQMFEACDEDAQEVEDTILVPFANECIFGAIIKP